MEMKKKCRRYNYFTLFKFIKFKHEFVRKAQRRCRNITAIHTVVKLTSFIVCKLVF